MLLFIIPIKIPSSSTTGTKFWVVARFMILSTSAFIGTGLIDVDKMDICYKYGYEIAIKNIDKIRKMLE